MRSPRPPRPRSARPRATGRARRDTRCAPTPPAPRRACGRWRSAAPAAPARGGRGGRRGALRTILPVPPLELLRFVHRARRIVDRAAEHVEETSVLLRACRLAHAIVELLRIGAAQLRDTG